MIFFGNRYPLFRIKLEASPKRVLKAKSERDTFGSDRRERNVQKSATTEYQHEGYACEGFAVWDDAGDKRPGILVFPEWAGVGEYTEKRAQCWASWASTPSWSTSMAKASARTPRKPARPR